MCKKNKEFTVSFLRNKPVLQPLKVNSQQLEEVQTTKLLGVYLSSDLKWTTHIDYVCSKASKRLYAIRTLKRCGVSPCDLRSVFCYFVRPLVEYACPVWHSSLPQYLNDQVEQIKRRAVKIICPHLTCFKGLEELD